MVIDMWTLCMKYSCVHSRIGLASSRVSTSHWWMISKQLHARSNLSWIHQAVEVPSPQAIAFNLSQVKWFLSTHGDHWFLPRRPELFGEYGMFANAHLYMVVKNSHCCWAWNFVLRGVRVLQSYQWEFQDPKMEVLYHIRPYFVGIFPYIGLI